MHVLILSTPHDVHAKRVAERLHALEAKVTFLRYEQFLNSRFQFEYSRDKTVHLVRLESGELIDLDQIDSIWHRRPGQVQFSGLPESWMDAMVESEAQQALIGMVRSFPGLLVNHPARDAECTVKLWQLDLARRVGFEPPETLVTNVPEKVSDFYKKCNGEVIYKLIGERSNFFMPKFESDFGVPTLPMVAEDLEHVKQVSIAPHLFQKRIDKIYDLRITAIGKKLFPVKIDSQAGKGKTDWRLDYSVKMELVELPESVHSACLSLMRELRLNYGAIDLCVEPDGNHIFFEINPAGQFLWMEGRVPELDLSGELACLLTGKSEPMAPARREVEKTRTA